MNSVLIILILLTVTIADEPIDPNENDDNIGDNVRTDPKSGQCSADQIIDRFIEIFTPDDYDEGKANIKYELKSYDEFFSAYNRMNEYGRNVRDRLSEFGDRLNGRMSEATMEVNLSADCVKSLDRIGKAARNGEIWALKCKSFVLSTVNSQIESAADIIQFKFESMYSPQSSAD